MKSSGTKYFLRYFAFLLLAMLVLYYLLIPAQASADTEFTTSRVVIVKHYSQEQWIVKAGDTLAGIVMELEPHNEFQRSRLAQYLLQNNPQAFIHNDPNLLRRGTTLQLPTLPKDIRKTSLISKSVNK